MSKTGARLIARYDHPVSPSIEGICKQVVEIRRLLYQTEICPPVRNLESCLGRECWSSKIDNAAVHNFLTLR